MAALEHWNYTRFRAEFVQKRRDTGQPPDGLTSYQRVHWQTERVKARRRCDYQPLTRMQLFDDLLPTAEKTTILLDHEYADGLTSSHAGALYATRYIVLRPTEVQALLRAQGKLKLDSDLPVFRQQPRLAAMWYCMRCHCFKRVREFDHDRRFPSRVAFYCHSCREDAGRRVYRVKPAVLALARL